MNEKDFFTKIHDLCHELGMAQFKYFNQKSGLTAGDFIIEFIKDLGKRAKPLPRFISTENGAEIKILDTWSGEEWFIDDTKHLMELVYIAKEMGVLEDTEFMPFCSPDKEYDRSKESREP